MCIAHYEKQNLTTDIGLHNLGHNKKHHCFAKLCDQNIWGNHFTAKHAEKLFGFSEQEDYFNYFTSFSIFYKYIFLNYTGL